MKFADLTYTEIWQECVEAGAQIVLDVLNGKPVNERFGGWDLQPVTF